MVILPDGSMEALGSMFVRRGALIHRFLEEGSPDDAARPRIEHVIRMGCEIEARLMALTGSLHREIAQLEKSRCLMHELQVAAIAPRHSMSMHA
jgi:hypothetical protein